MRFKHRKWANPFFIVSLAIAGIFGASTGIINKIIDNDSNIQKADASYRVGTKGRRAYLNFNGIGWGNWGDDGKTAP